MDLNVQNVVEMFETIPTLLKAHLIEIIYLTIPVLILADIALLYRVAPNYLRKEPENKTGIKSKDAEFSKKGFTLISGSLAILSLILTSESISNTTNILPLFSIAVVLSILSFGARTHNKSHLIATKIQGRLIFWGEITLYVIFVLLLFKFSKLASLIMLFGLFLAMIFRFYNVKSELKYYSQREKNEEQ